MRVAFNVADTPTKVPTIGDNGYQGFYPRKEILPKGWKWSRRHGRVGQDGLVGLAGNSHLGIVQWFIAAQQPPSLKAIAPREACGDLYREQVVRGSAWDDGLFDFIIEHVISGKRGVEDFKEMSRRSNTMNPYWDDKRVEIEKNKIPTYVVASYSSFLHTMGSFRGYMQVDTKNKWLRRWIPTKNGSTYGLSESRSMSSPNSSITFSRARTAIGRKPPKISMASLPFGDKEAVYSIEVQDFPIPKTDYKKLCLGEKNNLLESAPAGKSVVSYNSGSGSSPVAHAAFKRPW